MTTIRHILTRLSASRDRTQLTMRYQAFLRENKVNEEVMRSLLEIKEITNIWSNGRKSKVARWR